MDWEFSQQAIWLIYGAIAEIAVPITFIFGVCNIVYNMISSAFFRGRLHFGGRY